MAALSESVDTTPTNETSSKVKVIPTRMPVMELNLYLVDELDDEVKEVYKNHIEKHNKSLTRFHGDSGFDLLNVYARDIAPNELSFKYPLGVKMSMTHCALEQIGEERLLRIQPQGFMLLPRSSTGAKTDLRLSNSVGIIDSGYRGELCALLDNVNSDADNNEQNNLKRFQRNFQIVSFTGYPIHVTLVNKEEDLGGTERGEGGFGSTG